MNPEASEEVKKSVDKSAQPAENAETETESGGNMFMYILIGGVGLVVLVSLLVYFMGVSKKSEITISDLTITQPFVENNEFKTFTLPNGLRVLLSKSNDGMENSFVSLTVGVGSQTDPVDFCGFTHLIEHLLFTGSKNYPEDDHIVKVIQKYNGEDNGVTKSFSTSYYYKVGKGGLPEFAPVLADAVAFPNFDKEKIEKEINNVNSEISMRMTSNKNLGYYKMIKKIGNPEARIFRDGFAGIDTKNMDFEKLHEYISAFHDKYYSANIMTMAIITDEDLGYVERIVRNNFKNIPNKNIERPTHKDVDPYEPPFRPIIRNYIYYLQGFSKPSQLNLIFEVNSERDHPKFRPLEFFSFFLNYYSVNSLKDNLIRQDLITGFDDELVLQDYKRGIYMVQFDLTEKGEKHCSHIIAEFFKFVKFVEESPFVKKIFFEGANFSKFSFLFNVTGEFLPFSPVEQDNFERVLEFSEKLQEFSTSEVFTAGLIWGNYQPSVFEEIFLDLTIDKMIVFVESENFKLAKKEDLLSYDIKDVNGMNDIIKTTSNTISEIEREENEEKEANSGGLDGDRILEQKDSKHVKVSRDLEKEGVEKNERKRMYKDNFFDTMVEYMILPYALDFDNNKQFSYEEIPKSTISRLKNEVEKYPTKFDPVESLEVEKLMSYDMITNCEVPREVGNDFAQVEDIEKQSTDISHVKEPIQVEKERHQMKVESKQYEKNLNLIKIYKVLFNSSLEEHILTQKMLIIRSLLVYKICLIDEFDKDDEEVQAKLIQDTPRLKNYHKLYRKTLQPMSAVRVMIENPFFQENIIKGSSEDKQRFYLKVELLCLYIKHYLTLNFYKDFNAGNDLNVTSHSYALYFTFTGLSMGLNKFMEDMLGSIDALLHPSNYDMSILKNLQYRIVNNYSNYSSMTSLKLANFLLNLVIDELTMDIRSEENLKQIEEWVYSITPQDLAETLSHIQSKNKLTIMEAGNVNKKTALIQTDIVKKYLLKDENDESIKTENLFGQSINKVLDNMLLRFGGQNHHFMVRLPNLDPEDENNVYVTYFRSQKETVKVKLIGTMVSHWMRPYVFDELRNKKNLGYVAYESIREYYYRTGQMIMIQGQKFRPTEIEGLIEDTIRNFFEELKKKTNNELDDLKDLIVRNYTEFTNSIGDVASKLWDFIEEEYILEEEQDYETIATSITLSDLTEYYQSTFFDNQKRITLQLFSKELKEEEKNFTIDPNKRLIDLDYQIKSIDEMIQLRKDSVKTFDERKLRQINIGN